jgi:hypothetical protein
MLLKLLRCPFKSQISCHNSNIPSMSPSKVGGPILLTNSPRKQKKNKVNVCSILMGSSVIWYYEPIIHNITLNIIHNMSSSDWIIFGYVFFIFELFKKYIIGGHVAMVRLISFHHK